MRVDQYDASVAAALAAAERRGIYVIVRLQERHERRLVVVDGGVERHRSSRMVGIGVHAVTPDGSVGFASIDDIRADAAASVVEQAAQQANAARALDAERSRAVFEIPGTGRSRLEMPAVGNADGNVAEQSRILAEAQEALGEVDVGAGSSIRTTLLAVDEEWRIVRSDGTDISFATPRASLRHDLSGRVAGKIARASATVSGISAQMLLSDELVRRLTRRSRRAVADVCLAASAPPILSGSYRVVLRHALAKGLAHEAIGHLCESDVDGSVLTRHGRLRIGDSLARQTISVVDGPRPGDYAQQPVSANGLPRPTVALVDRGVLVGGLGDLFSAGRAGMPVTGACRASSFRDRPTPRMTNIRIEVADAAPLDIDPDDLAPEDVAAILRQLGMLDERRPTIYLTGYRGGMAHPRRGDFAFGADAAFNLTEGAAPHAPASFTGLAERALASMVAGIGALHTDAIGTCTKDGSGVSSSGGSHAFLVLEPDPDLVVSAAM